MKPRSSLPRKHRELLSRLTKLIHHGNVMRGNLVTMARTCGNSRCRCQRGHKHVSLYVYQSKKGRPRMIYIPRKWEGRRQRIHSNALHHSIGKAYSYLGFSNPPRGQ